MFNKLEDHYEKYGTSITYKDTVIPVTWGEIEQIYVHMGIEDQLDFGLYSRSY